MSDDGGLNVAAELWKLRGDMREGFAEINGRLDAFREAHDRTTRDIEDLEETTRTRFQALEGRVAALEERRWPLGPVAAVSGAVGTLAAVAAYLIPR